MLSLNYKAQFSCKNLTKVWLQCYLDKPRFYKKAIKSQQFRRCALSFKAGIKMTVDSTKILKQTAISTASCVFFFFFRRFFFFLLSPPSPVSVLISDVGSSVGSDSLCFRFLRLLLLLARFSSSD